MVDDTFRPISEYSDIGRRGRSRTLPLAAATGCSPKASKARRPARPYTASLRRRYWMGLSHMTMWLTYWNVWKIWGHSRQKKISSNYYHGQNPYRSPVVQIVQVRPLSRNCWVDFFVKVQITWWWYKRSTLIKAQFSKYWWFWIGTDYFLLTKNIWFYAL